MAGAVVPADALADNTGVPEEDFGLHGARLRPRVKAARRITARNVHPFTPANRSRPLAPGRAALRFAAPVVDGR